MTVQGVLLLGPPGSGKGTQAQLLAAAGGWVHLSTGDLLREEVKAGTPLGKEAKSYMDAGRLVPDTLLLTMVKDRLKAAAGKGFLLDGYPRTPAQAVSLDAMLADLHRTIDLALLLDVPEDEIVARLTQRRTCPKCNAIYHLVSKPPARPGLCDACGTPMIQRTDDTEAVVRRRLAIYEETTRPLLDLYRTRGILRHVIALGDRAAIQDQVHLLVGDRA
jgi:adenylate kinase